jgi:hypothetical protein
MNGLFQRHNLLRQRYAGSSVLAEAEAMTHEEALSGSSLAHSLRAALEAAKVHDKAMRMCAENRPEFRRERDQWNKLRKQLGLPPMFPEPYPEWPPKAEKPATVEPAKTETGAAL